MPASDAARDRPTEVYKIAARDAWTEACRTGTYPGSPDDRRDGFIHLSAAHQLAGTAARHFTGRPDLILIAFRSLDLAPHLRWEPSRGGEFFPHLYDALPTGVALWTAPLPLGTDGVPILPAGIREC